ncbi:dihydrofolate reductase family protein [Nakamurella endophytica]|uniref:Deaminase reductase n=1 Tax=Nakamurella endophytica TaxID=1748367 RepID=A0A917WBL4_9ACTN|nr:dihydrofolate reductase family protein [Nakamurella endophytica]GGL91884.1 deaminase reductase [Nakamurella endophytica]
MRKVVVYELVSLDGVAQDPDEWVTDWDEALDGHLAEVIASQDAVILGRRSYDEWAAYWPGSDVEPFAGFINSVAKYVVTSRPLHRTWTGCTPVHADLEGFVRDLRKRPGRDIGVHASISVARALLAADLVDELRLVVAPVVVGAGRRLLDGVPATRLRTLRGAMTPTGHLVADYGVFR